MKYLIVFMLLISLFSCGAKKTYTYKAKSNTNSNYSTSSRNLISKYAEVLGVSVSKIQNRKLYAFISDWEGTPYKFGGHGKSGIDCSGFSETLMKEVYSVQIPRMSTQQAEFVKRKYINDLKEGDLVFFKFGSKNIDHVGVYLQNGKFVHASTSKGVMISNLNDPWYRKVYVKAGSIQ